MKGILGKKIGMTEVFEKSGKLVPVTVIEVEPNFVTQIKTKETDGYEAIQLAAVTTKEKLSNKAKVGHFKKSNTAPKRFLKEMRGVNISDYTVGQEIKADLFEAGEIVDVTGISKGKGYQGVIKKNNQSRGPMGHGSKYHRGVGSLGTMLPKRVLKGKALPSHMGQNQVTIQNLEIISVDPENNYILVKGSIPGAKKSLVIVKSAVKTDAKNKAFELISYEEEVEAEETETPAEDAATEVEETEVTEETTEETEAPKETEEETSPEETTEEEKAE